MKIKPNPWLVALLRQLPEGLFKWGSITFVLKSVGFGAGFVFAWLVSHAMGAKGSGVFAISQTVLLLGGIIAKLGFDMLLVKNVASGLAKGEVGRARGEARSALLLTLAVSCFGSMLLWLGAEVLAVHLFKKENLTLPLQLTALFIPLAVWHDINSAVMRGQKKPGWFAFHALSGRHILALLLLPLGVFFFGENDGVPIVAFGIGMGILAIIAHKQVRTFWPASEQKPVSHPWRVLVSESFPMLLSASIIYLLGWMDTLVLGIFRTESEVGVYHIALQLSTVVNFGLNAVNSVAAPHFAELHALGDRAKLQTYVRGVAKLATLSALPFTLLFFLAPVWVMGQFGEEFRSGATVLLLLTAGKLVNSVAGPVGYLLQMTGHQALFQRILTVAALVNLVSNMLVVEAWGGVGVAFTSAVCMIGWNVAGAWIIYRKLGILCVWVPSWITKR